MRFAELHIHEVKPDCSVSRVSLLRPPGEAKVACGVRFVCYRRKIDIVLCTLL